MTFLGVVAVTPPEKRIASENDHLLLLALILALLVALFQTKKFSELQCPHDIGEVYDIAYTLTDLEK